MEAMADLPVKDEDTYGSDRLVWGLVAIVTNHRTVGGDFPKARPALVENLRTLQSALPAAIAEVEAAMKEDDA